MCSSQPIPIRLSPLGHQWHVEVTSACIWPNPTMDFNSYLSVSVTVTLWILLLMKCFFPLASGPSHMLCFPPPNLALPSLLLGSPLLPGLCMLACPTAQSQPSGFLCVILSSPMASKAAYMLVTPKFYLQPQHFSYWESQTQCVQNRIPRFSP